MASPRRASRKGAVLPQAPIPQPENPTVYGPVDRARPIKFADPKVPPPTVNTPKPPTYGHTDPPLDYQTGLRSKDFDTVAKSVEAYIRSKGKNPFPTTGAYYADRILTGGPEQKYDPEYYINEKLPYAEEIVGSPAEQQARAGGGGLSSILQMMAMRMPQMQSFQAPPVQSVSQRSYTPHVNIDQIIRQAMGKGF